MASWASRAPAPRPASLTTPAAAPCVSATGLAARVCTGHADGGNAGSLLLTRHPLPCLQQKRSAAPSVLTPRSIAAQWTMQWARFVAPTSVPPMACPAPTAAWVCGREGGRLQPACPTDHERRRHGGTSAHALSGLPALPGLQLDQAFAVACASTQRPSAAPMRPRACWAPCSMAPATPSPSASYREHEGQKGLGHA